MTPGEAFRVLRTALQLTQAQAGEALGTYQVAISRFESEQDPRVPGAKAITELVTDEVLTTAKRREAYRLLQRHQPQPKAPVAPRAERVQVALPPTESAPLTRELLQALSSISPLEMGQMNDQEFYEFIVGYYGQA